MVFPPRRVDQGGAGKEEVTVYKSAIIKVI